MSTTLGVACYVLAMNNSEDPSQKPSPPLEIPAKALSEEALAGLIESFILREGTDYGAIEISHETKVAKIQKQLAIGKIKIAFDPNTDSVTLLTELDWKKNSKLSNLS